MLSEGFWEINIPIPKEMEILPYQKFRFRGADVNLIRQSLVCKRFLEDRKNPLRLINIQKE